LRLERAVDLDGDDPGNVIGQVAREDAEAGPDLEHDVVGPQVGEPADHAEDVLVDQEVLAQLLLGGDAIGAHSSRKALVALASIRAASASVDSPRASARA